MNLKKMLTIGIASSALSIGSAAAVFADWSPDVTLSLPRNGVIVNSNKNAWKSTDSREFAVYGVSETNSLDPYARLQAETYARSSWTPIRQNNTQVSNSNQGVKNNYYKSGAKSNNLEPNDTRVVYEYDPR